MKEYMMNTSNYVEEIEKTTVIRNVRIEGMKVLMVDKIVDTFMDQKRIDPDTNIIRTVARRNISRNVETMEFHLLEVTREELKKYRGENISSFVLKKDGKLYYTEIPKDFPFRASTFLGNHRCASIGRECSRLSAAPDENGGCQKVREYSKRIEKYPWIKEGYETFNTNSDCFVVIECEHYKECPPREKLSPSELCEKKLNLAQFVFDDVKSLEEVKARIRKNKEKNRKKL